MKQSDIITIILISTVGMVVAFFASNALLGDPNMQSVKFKVVDPVISSELMEPDPELFNEEAINPTVEVTVGTCEDTNGNGMLDLDERRKCMNISDDTDNGGEDATLDGNAEGEGTESDGIAD